MKDPIVIDPPGFDQKAAWNECREYVAACGGLDHEDGSVNWRAAFGADPGCCSCPHCGEYFWSWGRAIRCTECGFVFPTDWWPKFSEGCQDGRRLAGLTVCPSADAQATMLDYARRRSEKTTHAYYRFGFEHCLASPVFMYQRLPWKMIWQNGGKLMYTPSEKLQKQMATAFTYHRPFGSQQERYVKLRDEAAKLALSFATNAPESRELSLALTKLEEAIMWVNAAIARNEEEPSAS